MAGAPSRRPSRPYTQWWYGQVNVVHVPSPSVTSIPRWRHTDEKAWIAPSLARATITPSPLARTVKKSPGFGMRLARPTHSHSRSNRARRSKARNSSDV